MRKQKFIENSKKRQDKVKEAYYVPHKPEPVAVKMEKPKSPTRIPRLSSKTTTKISDREARNRTKRIYERSDEFKEKKSLADKKTDAQERLEKRKAYAEKVKRKS